MKLLLQIDVPGLGDAGEVVDVAAGYGRNYLLPQRLALPNTPENRRDVETKRELTIRREENRRDMAVAVGKQLKNALLQVNMKAMEDGTLYGAVNASVVVDVIEKAKGFRIEERWVQLDSPIKKIGDYDLMLRMTGGGEVTFKLTVLPEDG